MYKAKKIDHLAILIFGAVFVSTSFAGSGQSTQKPKAKRQAVQQVTPTPFEESTKEGATTELVSSCSTEPVTVAEETPPVFDEIVKGELKASKFDQLKLSELILKNAANKLPIQLKFRTVRGLNYKRGASTVTVSENCQLYRNASLDAYVKIQDEVYFDPKLEKIYRLKGSSVDRNRGFTVTNMLGQTLVDGKYRSSLSGYSGLSWLEYDYKRVRSSWTFQLAQWNGNPSPNFYKLTCTFREILSENVTVRQLRDSLKNHFSLVIQDGGLYQPEFLEKAEELSY